MVNDASEQREQWVQRVRVMGARRSALSLGRSGFWPSSRHQREQRSQCRPTRAAARPSLFFVLGSRTLESISQYYVVPGPFPPTTLPVHGTSRTWNCSEAAVAVVFRQRFGRQSDDNVPPDDDDGAICDGICCWALDLSSDSIGACIVACYSISGHTKC